MAEIKQAAQDCFHACFTATDATKCAALFGGRLLMYRGWTKDDAAEMVLQALKLLEAIP